MPVPAGERSLRPEEAAHGERPRAVGPRALPRATARESVGPEAGAGAAGAHARRCGRRAPRRLRGRPRTRAPPCPAGRPRRREPCRHGSSGRTVTVDEDEPYGADGTPYALALRPFRGPVYLRLADGRRIRMPAHRWHARPTAADRTVLERCAGPVLDVGCGPGRLCRELLSRGVFALGVDIAPRAVALTSALGGLALCRSVFDRLPAERGLADPAAHRRQHRHRRRPSQPAATLRRSPLPDGPPRHRGRIRRRRGVVHGPTGGRPGPERTSLPMGAAGPGSAAQDRREPRPQRHGRVDERAPVLRHRPVPMRARRAHPRRRTRGGRTRGAVRLPSGSDYGVAGRSGERSTSRVISLGAKTRNGGPQKPVPRLV